MKGRPENIHGLLCGILGRPQTDNKFQQTDSLIQNTRKPCTSKAIDIAEKLEEY